jgi:hypothetical protein
VDEARKRADDEPAKQHAKAAEEADQAENQWHELHARWDKHVQGMRDEVKAKKAERDVKRAEETADWFENFALLAIDFAMGVVEAAEYAALNAALASEEAEADALTGTAAP